MCNDPVPLWRFMGIGKGAGGGRSRGDLLLLLAFFPQFYFSFVILLLLRILRVILFPSNKFKAALLAAYLFLLLPLQAAKSLGVRGLREAFLSSQGGTQVRVTVKVLLITRGASAHNGHRAVSVSLLLMILLRPPFAPRLS